VRLGAASPPPSYSLQGAHHMPWDYLDQFRKHTRKSTPRHPHRALSPLHVTREDLTSDPSVTALPSSHLRRPHSPPKPKPRTSRTRFK
jgi:hypothetical protein